MLSINISELLLTVLSFFVLMFLLNKLLFRLQGLLSSFQIPPALYL